MYKILIVSSYSQELNIVKKEIKKLALKNLKTSFLTTWKGNYNTILNLTRFLEQNSDSDFVINIWVCWYSNNLNFFQGYNINKKSDIFIQVARIFNLSNSKEIIVPHLIDFWELSSILCSENIIYNEKDLLWEDFVDMESYGFEKVCDSFSIPRIIIKVPIDKVWKETKNFDFEKANILLKNLNYNELLKKILSYLWSDINIHKKIVQREIFDEYKKYFWFTFSESEIFKKYYYKYLALIWNNFNEFFEKNKNFNKKDFIKVLDKTISKGVINK